MTTDTLAFIAAMAVFGTVWLCIGLATAHEHVDGILRSADSADRIGGPIGDD